MRLGYILSQGVKSMEWLTAQLNGENGSAIQLILITLSLAILLVVIVWIFRKITGSAARRANRSRIPRLSITDSTTVDDKRYLVMVRRDNVEHLLLIGGANDLVVETNIVRVQSAQQPTQQPTTPPAQAMAKEQPAKTPEPAVTAPPKEAIKPDQKATTAPAMAAAAVSAGVAGIAATAPKAADTAQSSIETVSDTATNVVEKGTDAIEQVTNTVAETVEAIKEPEIIAKPEIAAPKANNEADLESTISAKLDDALSGNALQVDTPSEVKVETVETNNSDDEMQRLLNELTGETKEPA